MNKATLKSIAIAMVISFCTANVSACEFLNELQKSTEKMGSITKTVEPADSISPKDFLNNAPSYSVKKVIETDSSGKAITNEDGTTRYSYLLIDKDGKVCEKTAVKKHLNAALKSGAFILLKVGGGATAGALIGKKAGGSKKAAWIGAGIGTAVGLLGSANDIKAVKKQVKLMKECKRLLEIYEKTFTEEGTPIDASIDLVNVEGINFAECEEITKDAADVKSEFLASKTEGESLDDVKIPDDLAI